MKRINKSTLATIGMVVCALFVIVGLLCTFGVFGGSVSLAKSYDSDYVYDGAFSDSKSYYDTGYASFGGDAYTYMSNNAAAAAEAAASAARAAAETFEAAEAAATAAAKAANNIASIWSLISIVSGLLMIGIGMFGVCYFAIIRCDCTIEKTDEIVTGDCIENKSENDEEETSSETIL